MNQQSEKILVLRFSALGDVAMVIPVLWALREQYPQYEIIFVSRPFAKQLTEPLNGITFVPVDFNKQHKGLLGLYRLFLTLKRLGPFSFVTDLHGVIRSRIISFFFQLSGIPVFSIDKGRKEKKALCRKRNKQLNPLTHSVERYQNVFKKGGLEFPLKDFSGLCLNPLEEDHNIHSIIHKSGIKRIGIAPFAKHTWKTWPESRMAELIELMAHKGYHILLFGGRGEEGQKLEKWARDYNNVFCLVGQLQMKEELLVMSRLDVMVSMDSANMHLASLVNTPVVSIWGATHPYAGFYGWNQDPGNAVQIDLECRPCSVFGNRPCHRGDFKCMNDITPLMVYDKVEEVIRQVKGNQQ